MFKWAARMAVRIGRVRISRPLRLPRSFSAARSLQGSHDYNVHKYRVRWEKAVKARSAMFEGSVGYTEPLGIWSFSWFTRSLRPREGREYGYVPHVLTRPRPILRVRCILYHFHSILSTRVVKVEYKIFHCRQGTVCTLY